jgi:hypothetical protein
MMAARLEAVKGYAATVWHWDLLLSIALGCAAGFAATSAPVRHGSVTVLIAETAIGGAFLAVVLSAIAVFVTFFDNAYRSVLTKAHDGRLGPALYPYSLVAFVAALTCLIALIAAAGWPAFGERIQEVALGLATFMTAWTVLGSASLVNLTIWHGTKRAEVMGVVEKGREARARAAASSRARTRV